MALNGLGNGTPAKKQKKYLIALEETRSKAALVCSVLIFICAFAAVYFMIVGRQEGQESPLHYFTVLSNLFSATGAAFMLPFAVEGIRKKRFVLPGWLVVYHYACATSVAITMIVSVAMIAPLQGIDKLTGPNFWLHIISPACTVILFQCVESGITFTPRDMFVSLIPYWAYMLAYTVMTVFIGEENGGWKDFYMTGAFWPEWVSLLIMLAIGFAVSALLRLVRNRLALRSRRRVARLWSEDLEPAQLLIEAFGLGRHTGRSCSAEELTVPLDIFGMISKRYGIPAEKLVKAYVKGAMDSMKERKSGKG